MHMLTVLVPLMSIIPWLILTPLLSPMEPRIIEQICHGFRNNGNFHTHSVTLTYHAFMNTESKLILEVWPHNCNIHHSRYRTDNHFYNIHWTAFLRYEQGQLFTYQFFQYAPYHQLITFFCIHTCTCICIMHLYRHMHWDGTYTVQGIVYWSLP